MKRMMTTREVADFLNVNEKMVYSLVSDKKLPATKITGKWLFPQYLVEQWVENNTTNFPETRDHIPPQHGLLILAGSNDVLLEQMINLYNRTFRGALAVFGNLGSVGGLHSLRQNLCHIASSHLLQDDGIDYNFQFASQEFNTMPVVVNFSKRCQGLLFKKDNPLSITSINDLDRPGLCLVNRSLGTGTRLLFDKELKAAGIAGEKIQGYSREVARHMDVGIDILAGRADVGPGIQVVAEQLDLGFLPMCWERFDLLVSKEHFFDKAVQDFLGLLQSDEFKEYAQETSGYDIHLAGKMIFQGSE